MENSKKEDENAKVIKIDHTYPEEEKVNKRKMLFGVLIFLSLCVFVVAVMVKGKEAAIKKESAKNQQNIVKLGEEKEKNGKNTNLTGNLVVQEKEPVVEVPFVAPEGTNVLLKRLSLKTIEEKIVENTDEYKKDPENPMIKLNLKKQKTNKKIIDYFVKKNPDEKVLELYIGEEMLYYTIKTEKGYYHINIVHNIGPGGEDSTKLEILPIEGVDMETFELYNRYSKDKNYVYRDAEIISGADVKTFIAYNRNYAKDKNYVYCLKDIMELVDYNTFEVINEDYAKDKNNIYTYGDVLEGADLETFEILNEFFAKDKNHVYTYGQIDEGLDPATFDPETHEF